MRKIFTRHLSSRIKKRNIGSHKVKHLLNLSGAKYIGNNKYKATREMGGRNVTVVYKREGNKKIALTSWKE